MDFERARRQMVDAQVRPYDITDTRLLQALRATPRELYVPRAMAALAYADTELPLAEGRRLLRPRELARLIQALSVRPEDRALVIAGGLGYSAAVLARLAREVILLEASPNLSFLARTALDQDGWGDVNIISTAFQNGWQENAPYDVILLEGATEFIPTAWIAQLGEGGRLAAIVREGEAGHARLYVKAGGVAAFRTVFDAQPPLTTGLQRAKTFSL